MKSVKHFSHNKIVCIDSDGCAFDSMENKHRLCFGPAMLEIWPLEAVKEQALNTWNEVNLYSKTRAINRFKGLMLVLKAFGQPDWIEIEAWIHRAKSLSNESLVAEENPALRRTLKWSLAVNSAIANLPVAKPFEGVLETVCRVAEDVDVVVVSSTNPDALQKEWSEAGLLPYVSQIMSHRDGSKKECIGKMIQKGYAPENIIMIGDAPGDEESSKATNVLFYPIIPGKEKECWNEFNQIVFEQFMDGTYTQAVQEQYSLNFNKLFEEMV